VKSHLFKLETENASTERTITLFHAKRLACAASTFQGCEVEVYRENPMWKTGDQLKLGQWVRVGYASDGDFYGDA